MRRFCLFLLLCCPLSTGLVAEELSERSMMITAAALTRLAMAVDAAIRDEPEQSAELENQALLQFAARADGELLSRFAGLQLRVRRGEGSAALLVCSADGRRALLEDTGCTAALDRPLWREAGVAACEFRLDLAALCPDRTAASTKAMATPVRLAARPRAVPLIEIAKVAWAREINKDSKQPAAELSRATPGSRLILWMAVEGSDAALTQLAARGKLPIRHKWYRETISGIRPEGVAMPVDEIEIPAAQPGVLAKLRQEVRSVGHFNWRTWSAKDKPGRGNWRVTVFYADNTPVLCATSGVYQPCEYEIEVR
ncbi:MAG: hypothetical protein H6R15_2200 [Proteobacteria bacterium]|nr:hypothetical protein [Pseudomonadota bacterium]